MSDQPSRLTAPGDMDAAAARQAVLDLADEIHALDASGDTYFYYDLPDDPEPDRRFPFATLITGDRHDSFSNLDREGVYRLNVGVSRQTYESLIGAPPPRAEADGSYDTGHDYTALDRIMPHPVYAPMNWVSVLNPSRQTFATVVRPLLDEAIDTAGRKAARRAAG